MEQVIASTCNNLILMIIIFFCEAWSGYIVVIRKMPWKDISFSFKESFLNMGDPEFDQGYHSNLFQLFSNVHGMLMNDEEVENMGITVVRMIKKI